MIAAARLDFITDASRVTDPAGDELNLDDQEADLLAVDQERLRRALRAALRREPCPRERRRAWQQWAADNGEG